MITSLDIAALRARLREYDPALPRCKQRITREQNYAPDFVPEEERAEWDMVTYVPCCRPEGHEGVCRNTRFVLGFPGYDTLTALLAEVERLRAEVERIEHARSSLDTALMLERNQERAAVVAFLREQAGQWDRDAAGWAAMNHASVMIERGLHRPGRA